MKRIHLYFRVAHLADRFFPGDRFLFSLVRNLIRKKKVGGVEKVFINLQKGLDELNVDYTINLPFKQIKPGEPVVVLGVGKYALEGYAQPNPIIAGIGLMTHPAYWPDLCTEYPVAKYLQHSEWAKNIYVPYYGADHCDLWPAGIETEKWVPAEGIEKKYDLLIYNKIMWDRQQTEAELKLPILKMLDERGLSYREIVYGQYEEHDYMAMLKECKAMIFLCEHESQGFACCEALSMNIPVFAWDQGLWLDPNRFDWGEQKPVQATSVPFFDDTCGMTFNGLNGFGEKFGLFWQKVTERAFAPRDYVLQNLTLKKSAEQMLVIVDEVYGR